MTTVKQVHAILSGAFGEAERDGVIPANPCRHARIPARPSGDQLGHEISVWSPGDLRRFLELTADERHGCLWRFMAMTGVRRGEALGLRWGDLDLDSINPRVSIRRAVTVSSEGKGTSPSSSPRRRAAGHARSTLTPPPWRRCAHIGSSRTPNASPQETLGTIRRAVASCSRATPGDCQRE